MALLASWLRHAGPDTSLSFDLMVNILLMVAIGGTARIPITIVGR